MMQVAGFTFSKILNQSVDGLAEPQRGTGNHCGNVSEDQGRDIEISHT